MAVSNINSVFSGFTASDIQRQPTRAEHIDANNQQIARIDREITARRNYIASNNEYINNLESYINTAKNLIQLNKESQALRKDYIKNLQESRDLDLKQIETLEHTNKQLLDLVDKSRRSRSASPEIITTNAINVSDNIKAASAKISEVKQVAKSEGRELDRPTRIQVASNALEEVAKNKQKQDTATQTEFTYSARARTYHTEGLDIKPLANEFTAIKNLENRIYQSQKNLYESIMTARMSKLL